MFHVKLTLYYFTDPVCWLQHVIVPVGGDKWLVALYSICVTILNKLEVCKSVGSRR